MTDSLPAPETLGLVDSLKLNIQPGDMTDDCVAAGIARRQGIEHVAKAIKSMADLLFECIAALSGGLSRMSRPTVAMMLCFLHSVHLKLLVVHHEMERWFASNNCSFGR